MIHQRLARDPGETKDRRAAIVCGHVAAKSLPVLYASRDEPLEEADSGWQFTCNKHEEDLSEAKVCAIYEVVEIEPSLAPLIDLPSGTKVIRDAPDSPWKVWVPPTESCYKSFRRYFTVR